MLAQSHYILSLKLTICLDLEIKKISSLFKLICDKYFKLFMLNFNHFILAILSYCNLFSSLFSFYSQKKKPSKPDPEKGLIKQVWKARLLSYALKYTEKPTVSSHGSVLFIIWPQLKQEALFFLGPHWNHFFGRALESFWKGQKSNENRMNI